MVTRPIWRRFLPRFFGRAAAHVRAGGHAAIVYGGDRVDLLLPLDRSGELTELAWWSLLSIEHATWSRVRFGAARGLALTRVRPHYAGSVLDWCERDAVHPGPTRRIQLDCLSCAACCHDADVVLEPADLDRWHRAGRSDLTRRTYVRRSADGKIALRFADTGRCPHLGRDRRCTIYSLRPATCSFFLVGSEACLAAREETFGLGA